MLADSFRVGKSVIQAKGKPYVIAEAGSNFDQSLDTARRLIDASADCGADAIKFQLFRAKALYPDGGSMYEIFKSVELNPDWVSILARHAGERGVTFFASTFDLESVKVLENAGVLAHKVASSEATNLPLLSALARTGKPIFLSTGMCDLADIELALQVMSLEGARDISVMQCGARYPLPDEETNLRVISTYQAAFGGPVGFSDHTLGGDAAIAALALGACVFEKHLTLDKKSKGPDHFYALEPKEMAEYVGSLRRIHQGLGDGRKEMLKEERLQGRRDGVCARRAISSGTILKADDLDIRRPAPGIRARDVARIVGATARHDINAGDPIDWADVRF
jgi:sialic acid synthase SpsE